MEVMTIRVVVAVVVVIVGGATICGTSLPIW